MPNYDKENFIKTWPKVSVTIITFNHEAYIAETLNSVLMQKYSGELEIIVRDDCSTDNTMRIIEKYAKSHPCIKPVPLLENSYKQGVEPMAAAFRQALGEYIFFLEGDDFWTDPYKIQVQVAAMTESGVDLSFHPMEMHSYQNSSSALNSMLAYHGEGDQTFTLKQVVSGGPSFMSVAGIAVTARAMRELPAWFYDGLPFGDYFLQVLCSRRTGALYIGRAMGYYRYMSPGSWTAGQKQLNMHSIKYQDKLLQSAMRNLFFELEESAQSSVTKVWVKETINSAIKASNNGYRGLAVQFFLKSFKLSPATEIVDKLKLLVRMVINK